MYIHGIGYFHPDNVIDNQFLEDLEIDTNDEWITSRVGIKERRTVLDLNYLRETKNCDTRKAIFHASHTSDETASIAAEMALKNAGLKPSDIGLVLQGGCAPEYSLPATACVTASQLGITAPAVDLSSACSTFAAQMRFVAMMDTDQSPDYILLIQAENWTKTINYADRNTAVLIGDGTAATIVSKKHLGKIKVHDTLLISDPSGWNKVQTPSGAHFSQQGAQVQKFAIKKTISTVNTLQEKYPEIKTPYFISHQANLTMLDSVCSKLGIAAEKHLFNIDKFGNTGASGAPTVLAQQINQFKAGDYITLVVVGAGLTWGGMLLEVLR